MTKTKSPGLAGFLSLIVPGLGQAYNGHFIKALSYFAIPFILWNVGYIFFPSASTFGRGLFNEYLFATLIAFIIRILSAVDAKRSAEDNGDDFSLSEMKPKEFFSNKKNILVILFFIFIIWGLYSTSQTDYGGYGFNAKGEIVANNSSIALKDYSAAEDDTFYAKSEDQIAYHGTWAGGHDAVFIYNVDFNVNLSDVKWDIDLFDKNNKNMSESLALADLDENLSSLMRDDFENGVAFTFESDIGNQIANKHYDENFASDNLHVENGVLTLNGSLSSSEPINISDDVHFKITLVKYTDSSRQRISKDIKLNITIPKENINIQNPGDVKLESGRNYNDINTEALH